MVVSLPVYNFCLGLVMRSRKRRFHSITAIAIASATGIEQYRDAGEVLFGTLAGFALQLGFGQFDRRTIRRQRKFADITAEIDRRPIRVGLSATRSEQIGEGRTVGVCRRMEVFDNSASMSGLLLRVCKMQIQFREAELPVDLRPRKLEVVF